MQLRLVWGWQIQTEMSWVVLLLATALAGLDSLLRVHFRSALHQGAADIWEKFLSWRCQRCKRVVQKHITPLKEFFLQRILEIVDKRYVRILLHPISGFISLSFPYSLYLFSLAIVNTKTIPLCLCTCRHLTEMPFSLFWVF